MKTSLGTSKAANTSSEQLSLLPTPEPMDLDAVSTRIGANAHPDPYASQQERTASLQQLRDEAQPTAPTRAESAKVSIAGIRQELASSKEARP